MSRVQRVLSVGVTGGLSLLGILVSVCATQCCCWQRVLAYLYRMDCTGIFVLVGIIPSMMQESIMIVICMHM